MKRKSTKFLAKVMALTVWLGTANLEVFATEMSASQVSDTMIATVSDGSSFSAETEKEGVSENQEAVIPAWDESSPEYREWKESLSVAVPQRFSLRAKVNGNLLSNEYLELWASNGYFTLGTTEGDPQLTSDNNKTMVFGHPDSTTSYTTINVGGNIYQYSSSNGAFDEESDSYVSTNVYGGVEIRQELKIVNNKGTDRDDVVQVKYTACNTNASSVEVGTRIMIDTMLGNNDAAPFKVPGYGNITTETEFTGSNIPTFWQAFDSLTNPGVISQGRFLTDGYDAPDKVQFTNWGNVYRTQWGYQVRKGYNNGDSAVSVIWNPEELKAGETKDYVTYYGLSEFEANLLPPLALAVSADAVMNYDGKIQPELDIIGYIQNISGVEAKNVVVKLELPQGLRLISENSSVKKESMLNNEEEQVSWRIVLDTTIPQESYTIKVVLSADDCVDKIVSKNIKVNKGKKAIVVIPGIAGTRLYGNQEVETKNYLPSAYNENKHHFTFKEGHQFWEPYTSTQTNKLGAITGSQNKIQSEAMMMICDNDGNSKVDIRPETEGEGEKYGAQNTYTELVNKLKEAYSDEYDVRFWGYDWRKDVSDIALGLEDFIETEGYSEVVLVCHSMGGLVASKYLANSSENQQRVKKLITMGTPYLGSPKALYVFETGHLLDWASSTFCMATPIKAVANNFTSVYELLPTQNYFDLNNTTYVQYQNNNGFWGKKKTEDYDYNQTKQLISNRSWAKNKNFLEVSENFAETLFVDGEHITNSVDSYYIIGYNRDTILEVEEEYNKDGSFDKCNDLTVTNGGDETVPVISANIGGTADPDKTYYIQETHTGLVANDKVIELVKNIINDLPGQYDATISKTCPDEINEKGWWGNTKTVRIQLKIECPVDLAMIDEKGEEWAYVSPEFIYNESDEDGTFYFLGKDNDAKMAYLQDDNYSVKLIGTDEGTMKYTMSVFDAGYEVKRIVFENVMITEDTVIYTNTDRFGEIILNVDEDDNGSIDYQIYPDYTMEEEEIAKEEENIDLSKVSVIVKNQDTGIRMSAENIGFENAVFAEGKCEFFSNNNVKMNSENNNIGALYRNSQLLESDYSVKYSEIEAEVQALFSDVTNVAPASAIAQGSMYLICYLPNRLSDFVINDNIMICTSEIKTEKDCLLYSRNGNISLYTSDMDFEGVIYAPNGTVTINSNNITIKGTIIADKVIINGQNISFK